MSIDKILTEKDITRLLRWWRVGEFVKTTKEAEPRKTLDASASQPTKSVTKHKE